MATLDSSKGTSLWKACNCIISAMSTVHSVLHKLEWIAIKADLFSSSSSFIFSICLRTYFKSWNRASAFCSMFADFFALDFYDVETSVSSKMFLYWSFMESRRKLASGSTISSFTLLVLSISRVCFLVIGQIILSASERSSPSLFVSYFFDYVAFFRLFYV